MDMRVFTDFLSDLRIENSEFFGHDANSFDYATNHLSYPW